MSNKPETVETDLQDSFILCNMSQGSELRATLIRLTRFIAVFEIYNPSNILRTSEVLSDFRIIINARTVYCGKAVVSKLIDMGGLTVCEVKLEESGLAIGHFSSQDARANPRAGFAEFFKHWEKTYRVLPEFKVVIADMQMLLLDLRLWLEEVELGMRSESAHSRQEMEQEFLQELVEPLVPTLGPVVERFEAISAGIEPEFQPAHALYARRQLHPVVLCSPFLYRTFQKPLGYAGDYEMVAMMLRNPFEGASLFAKIINAFYLNTPPVVAHRNRIDVLHERLAQEALRGAARGKPIKIFNLGCGPAVEIQRFLQQNDTLSDFTEFTLFDFNDETIQHTTQVLNTLKNQFGRRTSIQLQRKSVHHMLKESSGKPVSNGSSKQYDLVYCAGLFDYLSDRTCKQLMNIFWEWVAPGGLLLVSNVETSNPSRGWMEHVLDWNLIYRNAQQMDSLIPERAPADAARIIVEPLAVNIFLEIRKPDHA